MTVFLAMLTGALTSAAWIAKKPFCFVLGFIAYLLFSWVRYVNG